MQNGDGKPTVLIVDDDVFLVAALRELLELEGYRCFTTRTGTEAIARISDSNLDVALIDVHLPDMNGLALAHVIRTQHGPAVPIVVMSGDASKELLAQLNEAGATYFFSKPLRPQMLMDWLRNAFSASVSDAH